MTAETRFDLAFRALTGSDPFPWQDELYRRISAGDWGGLAACDIPTGLGKTAVIPVWLVALANCGDGVPRRLVYVVNRRTVVDQATAEAERLRDKLVEPDGDGPAPEVREARLRLGRALRDLAADPGSGPLAISTLRGQFADNREWSADPARPAIIVGTVDMIGSRLLFGGYGLGFKTRPMHAGFLGQDALLVHDEAHLEPAFQALIEAVRDEQENEPALLGQGKRLKVVALTATPRGGDALRLTEADRTHPEVSKRIEARKSIRLHEADDGKGLPERLAELASSHGESMRDVLVFARSVEAVEGVVARLRKETPSVVALTGTLRGKERDALVRDPVFRRFLPGAEPGEDTAYLVCTSAGEVGVNLSADHLVCDLSTFESMAQRFGRVNRFGERDDTRIDVLHPRAFDGKNETDARRARTLDLLRALNGDGSPAALGALDPDARRAAFSPEPVLLPTSDILFDAWAMTSVRGDLPGRPPVGPYLHGLTDREPAATVVAWREEVDVIGPTLRDRYQPDGLLEAYPLKPHELLRDRSDRVFKQLAEIAERHPDAWAWLLDDDGSVQPLPGVGA
jgi:CRISPR-associated endonuclease/helicase Cas3